MSPYLWAILASLAWGCAPIVEKLGLAKLPVWAGLFYRSLGVMFGALILFIFKYNEIKEAVTKDSTGWHLLAIGGFLASIIGQIFFYNALKAGEASRVVPLGATYPLISFILGIIFLKETMSMAKLGGLIFIILGAVLLR